MPLERGDVRRLQPLRTGRHFKLDGLAVGQRLVSFRLNRGEMDENVLSRLALDKPETFAGIEPLNCSLFFQLCISFLFELFDAFFHCPQTKKGLQVWTCNPFNNF
jgi:hypothetical protein